MAKTEDVSRGHSTVNGKDQTIVVFEALKAGINTKTTENIAKIAVLMRESWKLRVIRKRVV